MALTDRILVSLASLLVFSCSEDAETGGGGGGSSTTGGSPTSTTSASTASATTASAATTTTSTGGGGAPSYNPLTVVDFEEGSNGESVDWGATTGGPVVFDTTHAHSGIAAAKVSFTHMENGYGGYQNLSESIGPGETVWYRVYLYMPATLSLSYGDTSGDGFGWNKFLVLSEFEHEQPRMYVQPRSEYKVDFGEPGFAGTGVAVNHDGLGQAYCNLHEDTYAFPRDQWFALQMAWHVAEDDSAYVRVWSDDTFIGECPGAGVVEGGYEVQSWGIGDYWNGGAWIQNGSTGDFWVDDVVVTKETPSTTDAGGRPFVSPEHFW